MHYEKAELILQQLMAGDRDLYLVRDAKDGRAAITDRPNQQQKVVGELKRKRLPWLEVVVASVFYFLCPITVSSGLNLKNPENNRIRQKAMYVRPSASLRSGPDDTDEVLEECKC